MNSAYTPWSDRAQRAANPEINELETATQTARHLAERCSEPVSSLAEPHFTVVDAIVDTAVSSLTVGEDPSAAVDAASAEAFANHPAALATLVWNRVVGRLDGEIKAARLSNRDDQIRWLHEQVVTIVDTARQPSTTAEQRDDLFANYQGARGAYRKLVSGELANGLGRDADRATYERFCWLANFDAWENCHAADIEPLLENNRHTPDVWGATDRERFDWLIRTPTAAPWAPTPEQVREKQRALIAEYNPAAAETRVISFKQTATAPNLRRPAAAIALGATGGSTS